MFISALGSISGGANNRLGLPRVKSSIVFLVDGMGYQNLLDHPAYARNLLGLIEVKPKVLRCGFPSSTAVSLTSFGTGLRAGEHGIAGYQVLDSEGSIKNMLNGWSSEAEAAAWQSFPTVAETSGEIRVSMVAA